ncbi:MAG: hypothetical protein KC493_16960 [Bacteriovoracaceae bacterium]|nr:hypothetical protein [Bacteriovoracaceae bacterium]
MFVKKLLFFLLVSIQVEAGGINFEEAEVGDDMSLYELHAGRVKARIIDIDHKAGTLTINRMVDGKWSKNKSTHFVKRLVSVSFTKNPKSGLKQENPFKPTDCPNPESLLEVDHPLSPLRGLLEIDCRESKKRFAENMLEWRDPGASGRKDSIELWKRWEKEEKKLYPYKPLQDMSKDELRTVFELDQKIKNREYRNFNVDSDAWKFKTLNDQKNVEGGAAYNGPAMSRDMDVVDYFKIKEEQYWGRVENTMPYGMECGKSGKISDSDKKSTSFLGFTKGLFDSDSTKNVNPYAKLEGILDNKNSCFNPEKYKKELSCLKSMLDEVDKEFDGLAKSHCLPIGGKGYEKNKAASTCHKKPLPVVARRSELEKLWLGGDRDQKDFEYSECQVNICNDDSIKMDKGPKGNLSQLSGLSSAVDYENALTETIKELKSGTLSLDDQFVLEARLKKIQDKLKDEFSIDKKLDYDFLNDEDLLATVKSVVPGDTPLNDFFGSKKNNIIGYYNQSRVEEETSDQIIKTETALIVESKYQKVAHAFHSMAKCLTMTEQMDGISKDPRAELRKTNASGETNKLPETHDEVLIGIHEKIKGTVDQCIDTAKQFGDLTVNFLDEAMGDAKAFLPEDKRSELGDSTAAQEIFGRYKKKAKAFLEAQTLGKVRDEIVRGAKHAAFDTKDWKQFSSRGPYWKPTKPKAIIKPDDPKARQKNLTLAAEEAMAMGDILIKHSRAVKQSRLEIMRGTQGQNQKIMTELLNAYQEFDQAKVYVKEAKKRLKNSLTGHKTYCRSVLLPLMEPALNKPAWCQFPHGFSGIIEDLEK